MGEKDVLLDKRLNLIVWIAPVQYNSSGSSKYMENFNISIEYEAPLKITNLQVRTFFNTAEVNITLKGNTCVNLTLLLDKRFIEKRVCVNGKKDVIKHVVSTPGEHEIEVVAYNEQYKSNIERKKFNLTAFIGEVRKSVTPSSAHISINTCCESVEFGNDVKYRSLSASYYANKTVNILVTPSYCLSVKRNETAISYLLLSPFGILKKNIDRNVTVIGNLEERILDLAIEEMNNIKDRVSEWKKYYEVLLNASETNLNV